MVRQVFVALAVALLLVGCIWSEPPTLSFPEADAIGYLAVRDEALDAEVLWNGVHDDIKAETSRSEFIDCVYANADRTGPAAPASAVAELEPSLIGVATYGGEVPSDNVLIRDGITYSVADRREDRGIISVDVRVEGPDDTSTTTVLLAPQVDLDDPVGGSPYWVGEQRLLVAGTVPEDPCLVGAEALSERLQTTGMVSVGRDQGQLPELIDYRVLAVVWDGVPGQSRVVGGAFWWMNDEGNGGNVVHPPNEGGGDTAGEIEDDSVAEPDEADEPRRAPDWITQAFLPTKTAHIEPGTYTIEVWANPSELTPSTNPSVPADANERNCSVEVEVTAGTHLNVFVNDIPPEGGECPHETDIRKGP